MKLADFNFLFFLGFGFFGIYADWPDAAVYASFVIASVWSAASYIEKRL